jgi:hypothetical protein
MITRPQRKVRTAITSATSQVRPSAEPNRKSTLLIGPWRVPRMTPRTTDEGATTTSSSAVAIAAWWADRDISGARLPT